MTTEIDSLESKLRRHSEPPFQVPKYLLLSIVLYCAASLLHFVHNAEFLADYPNLPEWLGRSTVYLAWLAITTVGVLGIVLIKFGFRHFGLLLTAGYAGLGFAGLDHYWMAPASAHSLGMNASIWLEVAAASALLLATGVALFSSARQRKAEHLLFAAINRRCVEAKFQK